MSLDKAIEHKHEHREQYRGPKAFDKTCRNHGSCPWFEENRKHKNDKRNLAMDDRERDSFEEEDETDEG